ncbi:hypothetical protein H6768_01915 [Candidatus Peribacteria bacterium]|nr:hypothetical protein [Candidatus Peribacteria bacterium]
MAKPMFLFIKNKYNRTYNFKNMIYILLSLNLVGIVVVLLLILQSKNNTDLRGLFREERDSARNSEKLLRDEINGSFK